MQWYLNPRDQSLTPATCMSLAALQPALTLTITHKSQSCTFALGPGRCSNLSFPEHRSWLKLLRSVAVLRTQRCCSKEPESCKQIQQSQLDGGRMVNWKVRIDTTFQFSVCTGLCLLCPAPCYRGHNSSAGSQLKTTAGASWERQEAEPTSVLIHFAVHLDNFHANPSKLTSYFSSLHWWQLLSGWL